MSKASLLSSDAAREVILIGH